VSGAKEAVANTVKAHLVRESSNGYVARLRKDGLRHARAEFDARAARRQERREQEMDKRRQAAKDLAIQERLRLVPLRLMGRPGCFAGSKA
jgi:hypothetical protein